MIRIKGRGIATGLTVGAMALGLFALTPGVASAAAGPTVTATPNQNLHNKQKVTVQVSSPGLTPGDLVAVVECNPKVAMGDQGACDQNQAHAGIGQVLPDGSVSPITIKVETGVVGDGTCGTNTGDRHCVLFAAEVLSLGPPPVVQPIGGTPITFKVPTVTLSQSALLTDGESVNVKAVGFPKNDANLAIVECGPQLFAQAAAMTPFNACDVPAGADVSSNAGGTVNSAFTILTTSYSDSVGDSCSGGATCYVAVGDKTTFQGGIAAFQSAP